jgi:hypothetical protein
MYKRKPVEPRGTYVMQYTIDGHTETEELGTITEQAALDREEDLAYDCLENGIEPPRITVYETTGAAWRKVTALA